jgi:hypothetical protein
MAGEKTRGVKPNCIKDASTYHHKFTILEPYRHAVRKKK